LYFQFFLNISAPWQIKLSTIVQYMYRAFFISCKSTNESTIIINIYKNN
jgi:hypothetical protein